MGWLVLLRWQKGNGYNWDWCLVVKVRPHTEKVTDYQRKFSVKNILTRLSKVGRLYAAPSHLLSNKAVY
jgi:hypothetical protein